MQQKLTPKEFEENMKAIMQATTLKRGESLQEKNARIEKAKKDYSYFIEYYLPMYATAKCGWFHVFIANMLLKNKMFRGLLKWFRGAAKSVHANVGYPMWLKINGELHFMVLVGQNNNKAQILLSDIQAQMMSNQRYINDYGEQYAYGNWEDGSFRTKDGCFFFALGFGQSPRGLRNEAVRPDYIVVDDVDSKELSKNPDRVKQGVDWVCDDLMGCFDVGAQRMLVVNNAPFVHSIIGYLEKEKLATSKPTPIRNITKDLSAASAFTYTVKNFWHCLQVNAVDKNFNPSWHEKYTKEYWQAIRDDKSLRTWLREYMNQAVTEGKVFKNEWLQFKDCLPYSKYDHLLCYFDPSYKATLTSDFKAIVLLGKTGTQYHILKAFVRKCSISTAVKKMYDLNDEIQKHSTNIICNFWMEDVMIQDLFLDEFTEEGNERGYQLAIRRDKRDKPDKYTRIENISPLFERGHVFFNSREEKSSDMLEGIEQFKAFDQGSKTHDDFPDAVEGGIWLLNRKGKTSAFSPVVEQYERHDAY